MNQTEYLESRSARLKQHAADLAEGQAERDREELAAMLAELNEALEREAVVVRVAS